MVMLGGVSGLDSQIIEIRIRDLNCELFIVLIFQPIFILSSILHSPITIFPYNGRERGFMVVAPIR